MSKIRPTRSTALTSRVVVITGASSGIGRATALAFAADGAQLVLAARNREALDAVAQDCAHEGARTFVLPTDVTDADAVQALADAALRHFGRIDVWINNVGVGAVGRFEDTPMASHRRVVEANLLGHMNGALAVLPHFRQQEHGVLINMISAGGWVAAPYAGAYTASKFGLRGWSESLRAELVDVPGVHVCEVYPAFVDTPGLSHGANYSGRQLRPPPPLSDPRRVAAALVHLARHPQAVLAIGAPALPGRLAHAVAPNLLARGMKRLFDRALARAEPAAATDGNLFTPSRSPAIDGGFRHRPLLKPATGLALALAATTAACVACVVINARRKR
ncbi:MAG: short-chain dehydrogenase/reductase [Rhodoferax sp.]|nr:short-chain dehydrogenase/reductase [Rhodoferax sp.]